MQRDNEDAKAIQPGRQFPQLHSSSVTNFIKIAFLPSLAAYSVRSWTQISADCLRSMKQRRDYHILNKIPPAQVLY